MKLASVGIDPNHVGFAADHVSIHDSTELLNVFFHWLFYYLLLETTGFFNGPTSKMKLASVGIDPDRIEFAAEYVSTEPLKIPCAWPFYYVILEAKCPFFLIGGATRLSLLGSGIEPIAPAFTVTQCGIAIHLSIGLFYYVILKRKAQVFFIIQHGKWN